MSLDGFIAGPNGEFDWIVMDPTFDFAALFSEFDTLLIGRDTFDLIRQDPAKTMAGMRTVVFSPGYSALASRHALSFPAAVRQQNLAQWDCAS
jgi:dihydrofolate reductase